MTELGERAMAGRSWLSVLRSRRSRCRREIEHLAAGHVRAKDVEEGRLDAIEDRPRPVTGDDDQFLALADPETMRIRSPFY